MIDYSRVVDQRTYHIPAVSTDTDTSIVIPGIPGTKAVIRNIEAKGGHADADLHFHLAQNKGETLVNGAVAANDDDIDFDSDGTADQLSGIAVAANDFCIVTLNDWHELRGALQFMLIASVDAANAAHISVDSGGGGLTGFDGDNVPRAAVLDNAKAWIVWAEDRFTIAVGNASISRENGFVAGYPGQPIAIVLEAGDGTEHYASFGVDYVKTRK